MRVATGYVSLTEYLAGRAEQLNWWTMVQRKWQHGTRSVRKARAKFARQGFPETPMHPGMASRAKAAAEYLATREHYVRVNSGVHAHKAAQKRAADR